MPRTGKRVARRGDPVRRWGQPQEAKRFLAAIQQRLELMADCDVILYQAGAEPHVDDPLGGWTLALIEEAYRRSREEGSENALGAAPAPRAGRPGQGR